MDFNNGFLIQWGLCAGASRNVSINYAVSLNWGVFYINGHPIYKTITGNHDYDPNFDTSSKTSFLIYADPGGGVNAVSINWVLFGK